ncbi:flavodoxin family protein [uncultured Pseudoflavonifractor sp.]|uniref:flavodoxin family protein n=1 Tax=uncultured Pseudoflavonifractor sp. TaxID=1221379 RepID=UPI0025F4C3D1|nr:flavodoxin family protein [uncultured Pseudoflavonifractor sp.]
MKILMVNGSANQHGCTYTALSEIGAAAQELGAEWEIVQLGGQPMRDCIGCNQCGGKGKCVFADGGVNEFLEKAMEADGFVFGTPVYYAHPSGRLLSFLDRAFYAASGGGKSPFAGKPGAAIASARRAGTTASLDVINKYFGITSMPVVSGTYWNMVHGRSPEEVRRDLEGLQTMRNIGRNMVWMIEQLKKAPMPQQEKGVFTNFIRPAGQ